MIICFIFTSAKVEVMRSVRFICHSVCVQDYCKSSWPTSVKRDVMLGVTSSDDG